jgi:predicted transcriptional regulator
VSSLSFLPQHLAHLSSDDAGRATMWRGASPMAKTKQLVLEVLESLPDDCSLEDVQYELCVRQRIAQGERDADHGKTVPHEQVMGEAREWLRRF